MSRLFQSTKAHEARAQVAQEQRRALASRSVSPVPPMHFGHQPSAPPPTNASNMTHSSILHANSSDARRSSAPSRSSVFCARSSLFQDSRNGSVSERRTHHVDSDDKENSYSTRPRGKRPRDEEEGDSRSSTPRGNRVQCQPRASQFSSTPSRSPVMVSSRLLELAQPRRLNVIPGNRMKLPSPPPRKISPPATGQKKRTNLRPRVDAPFLSIPLDTEETPAGCSPTGLRSTAPPRQEISASQPVVLDVPSYQDDQSHLYQNQNREFDVISASDPSPSPVADDSMFAPEEAAKVIVPDDATPSKSRSNNEGMETLHQGDACQNDVSINSVNDDVPFGGSVFCQPAKTLQEARLQITPEDRVRLSLMLSTGRCGRGSDVTISPMSEGERLSLLSPSSRVKTSQELRCSSALDDPVLRSTVIEIRNSIQLASPRPPLAPSLNVPAPPSPGDCVGLCGDWPTEMFSHHFPQGDGSVRGSQKSSDEDGTLGVSSVMYCTADLSIPSQEGAGNRSVVQSSLQSLEDQYKDLEREWKSLNSTAAVNDPLPSPGAIPPPLATVVMDSQGSPQVSSVTFSSAALSDPPSNVVINATPPYNCPPRDDCEGAIDESVELLPQLAHNQPICSSAQQPAPLIGGSVSHSRRGGDRSTLISKAQSRADASDTAVVTEAHDCLAVVAERFGFDVRRAMTANTMPLLLCGADALEALHNAHARLQGALLLRSVPAEAARAMRTAVSDIGRALQIIESTRPCAPPEGGDLITTASSLDWQASRPVESGAATGSVANSKSGSAVRLLSPAPLPPNHRERMCAAEGRPPQPLRRSPTLITSSTDEETYGGPLHLPSEPHVQKF